MTKYSERVKAFLADPKVQEINLTANEIKLLVLNDLDDREILTEFLLWCSVKRWPWDKRNESKGLTNAQ